MAKRKSTNQSATTKRTNKTNRASKVEQLGRREPDTASWLPAPGNLVRRFRDEMDKLFQDFGFDNVTRALPNVDTLSLGMWAPEVEVFERAGSLVVHADLPGLSKEDITIDLTERAMTIEGERKHEHEESDKGYYRSERTYGRFSRRIPLPEGVDVDTATAQFRDGVLEVSFALPEAREQKTRKIEIAEGPLSARARAAGR